MMNNRFKYVYALGDTKYYDSFRTFKQAALQATSDIVMERAVPLEILDTEQHTCCIMTLVARYSRDEFRVFKYQTEEEYCVLLRGWRERRERLLERLAGAGAPAYRRTVSVPKSATTSCLPR